MAKQKYYVVWVGKVPGIYTSWGECQQQVNQFAGAKFKAFESRSEAEQAYAAGYKNYWGQQSGSKPGSSGSKSYKRISASAAEEPGEIDYDSISVDVGTRGNPGPVEYKGVDTQTGDILFSCGSTPGQDLRFRWERVEQARNFANKIWNASRFETKMAKLVCERVPSIEVVRMVNSGTEATMSAIRLARGYTGRSKIIKFEGSYHGHADSLLIKAGSGIAE